MITGNSLLCLKHAIVTMYIVLMSTQIIALEGFGVSSIKVIAMLLAPLIILTFGYFKFISEALVCGGIFLITMTVCAMCSSHLVAWNRIGYRAMYVMMFICIYYIIYEGCINLIFFKKIIRVLIVAYGISFIIQHVFFLAGFREIPILNFYGSLTLKGVFKPNGLAIEGSHAARILTVLYWSFLKLTEIEKEHLIKFKESWKDYTLPTLFFWFSMVLMGSATAMIGMFLILLYFFKRSAGVILCGLIAFILLMDMDIDNVTIKRVQVVFNSFFSDNVGNALQKGEGSGAVRIMPIVNTVTNLDLFSWKSWIGQGSVQNLDIDFVKRMFSDSRYIGDITDFGLFSYLLSLIFVYRCCIRCFFSMESLLFLFLATFSVGSVYYTWLMLILFCIVKYNISTYRTMEDTVSCN